MKDTKIDSKGDWQLAGLTEKHGNYYPGLTEKHGNYLPWINRKTWQLLPWINRKTWQLFALTILSTYVRISQHVDKPTLATVEESGCVLIELAWAVVAVDDAVVCRFSDESSELEVDTLLLLTLTSPLLCSSVETTDKVKLFFFFKNNLTIETRTVTANKGTAKSERYCYIFAMITCCPPPSERNLA